MDSLQKNNVFEKCAKRLYCIVMVRDTLFYLKTLNLKIVDERVESSEQRSTSEPFENRNND